MSPASARQPSRQWVVVANESLAIVYRRSSARSPLEESERLENSAARVRAADLDADRSGRVFDRYGSGRHALDRELHGAMRNAAREFARRIARRLEQARLAGEFEQYVLVAAPRFLGELRAALATTSLPAPAAAIDKDVVTRDTAFLRGLLAGA